MPRCGQASRIVNALPPLVRPSTSGTSSSIAVTSFVPPMASLFIAGYQKSHKNPASLCGPLSRRISNVLSVATLAASLIRPPAIPASLVKPNRSTQRFPAATVPRRRLRSTAAAESHYLARDKTPNRHPSRFTVNTPWNSTSTHTYSRPEVQTLASFSKAPLGLFL